MPEGLTLFQRIERQELRRMAGSVLTDLPAGMEVRPTQMRPFMKVPVVSTTALHWNVMPKKVLTPAGHSTSRNAQRMPAQGHSQNSECRCSFRRFLAP